MLDTTQKPPCQTLPDGSTFDMMPVEGGSFMMGSEEYGNEKPIHKVTLSSFYIGKYPVTQSLYKAVMNGENPSYFKGDKRPVEQVSWFDAVVFCNILNEICGYKPCYFKDNQFQHIYGKNTDGTSRNSREGGYELPNDGDVFLKPNTEGYRLPTEAEWEYAARGGDKSGNYKYAGGDKISEVAWYGDNSHEETKPVGLKLDNELGIYDMTGNVWEWCYDWYGDYKTVIENAIENTTNSIVNPIGITTKGNNRVFRGGSWFNDPQSCRPTNRSYYYPTTRDSYLGFRLVLFSLSV